MNNKVFSFIIIIFIIDVNVLLAQNGIVKSYYPEGAVQSEASFVNDVLDGSVITYFPDGKVCVEKNFSRGILDGYVREYYSNGQIKEEYFVKTGIKDGTSRKYLENGDLIELVNYSDGILTSRKSFKTEDEMKIKPSNSIADNANNTLTHSDNKIPNLKENIQTVTPDNAISAIKKTEGKKAEPITTEKINEDQKKEIPVVMKELSEKRIELTADKNETEILCDAQICPVPVGGVKAIQNNLVYPEHALRYGLEGKVTIIATITTEGDVIKTQVLKGLGLGCSEAAQEALRKTKFIPGETGNKPIETNATIVIDFKIYDGKSAYDKK